MRACGSQHGHAYIVHLAVAAAFLLLVLLVATIGALQAGGLGAWWSDLSGFWKTLLALAAFVALGPFLPSILLAPLRLYWLVRPPRWVGLYDAGTGRRLGVLTGPRGDCWIESLSFSGDDGFVLGLDSRYRLHVWSVPDGRHCGTLRGPWGLGCEVHALPDGSFFLCGGGHSGIHLHRLPDGRTEAVLRRPSERMWIETLAVSGDGRVLAVAVSEAGIEVRSLPDGSLLCTLDSAGRSDVLGISGDGQILVGHGRGSVRVWQSGSGEALQTWPCEDPPWAIAVTPDGSACAVGGYSGPTTVFDAEMGTTLLEIDEGDVAVYRLAFSPDGRRLAATTSASEVRVRDIRSGALLHALPGAEIGGAVAWSRNGRYLAALDER